MSIGGKEASRKGNLDGRPTRALLTCRTTYFGRVGHSIEEKGEMLYLDGILR
jgi:hypothetical protein